MTNRIYNINNVISFQKTDEKYGILSNMKGRLFLHIGDVNIFSSESLYQALRFTDYPEIQKIILQEKSPLIAKRIAYKYKDKTRDGWDEIKNNIMRLCLRIKYLQCNAFKNCLSETDEMPIVEISKKDTYWGTVYINKQEVQGFNILGRLLMELRVEAYEKKIVERINYILKRYDNLKIIKNYITNETIM